MSEKAQVVADFDAAKASFQLGEEAESQPAEPIAPPPLVERKRPLGKWDISWEKFQENLGEFGPAVKENFINIVKSGGRERWSRDVWTIANAALLEIPFIGPIASLTSMVGQTGLLVRNEVKKAKSLGKEEYLSRSALKQAGEAMLKVAFKREGKEIAAGKRGRAGGQTEDLVLTNTEAAIAGAFGVCSSLAAIAILEDISFINFIPGMKAAKRLYLAPLLTMLISSGFGALGESYFDVLKRGGKIENETLLKHKKAQFVEMVLAVNAPVMQIMTTMGIVTSWVEEYRAAHPKAEVIPAPPTPTLTPTPTETVVATGTPILVPTFEHTPTPSATEALPTEMPPSDFGWHAGEAVDSTLLEKAASQGHLIDPTPRTISILGHELQLYGFNLDNDSNRDVLAIKDDQGNYTPVIWETFGGFYKVDIPNDDIGPLNYPGDVFNQGEMDIFQVGSSGSGGEFSPNLQGGQNWDLDNDGDDDLIPLGNDQWFIDKDNDQNYNSETDLLLDEDEPPLFHPENGQAVKLVAEDGQMWWRDSEDKMTGLIKDAANQWFIDHEAKVLAPDTQDNIRVNGESMTASLVLIGQEDNPEFRVEFKNAEVVFNDGGKWVFDTGGKATGTLADGRNLHLDSAGETGIWAIQHALAVAHPDWSPDEVGKAAFRAPAETTRSSILNIHKPEPYHAVAGGDGGFWATNDQGQTVGVLGDGRTLVQDSRGGWDGVVQGGIINQASPQSTGLSPLQVGIISHQAVSMPEFSGSPQAGDFNQLSQSQQQAVFQVYNNQMAHYSLEKVAADYFLTNELGYSSRAAVNVYLADHPLKLVNTGFSAGNLGTGFLGNFGIDPDEFKRWLEGYHG
jgi:hypothetical protein